MTQESMDQYLQKLYETFCFIYDEHIKNEDEFSAHPYEKILDAIHAYLHKSINLDELKDVLYKNKFLDVLNKLNQFE